MRAVRRVVSFVLICLFCQSAGAGWAQSYPAKVVRIVQPGSAGSGADILARLVAGGLTQVFGQQVIVDNRPGAAANIGAEIAAKAPPDGYTLLLVNIAHAANVSLYNKLPYDLIRDFSTVTQIAGSPHAVVVHPSLPVKSIKELVALAKTKPGVLNYASVGVGTSTFLAAELFKAQAGVDMVNVSYKGGGPAVTAAVVGEISVYFSPLASSLPHIQQGRLRALAVTTPKRVPSIPELPTVAESGYPGYAFNNWYGLLAPVKTSKEAITTIREAVVVVLKKPDVIKRFTELGFVPIGDQPEEFSAYIKSEVEKLGKLIRDLNLTTDAPTS
jgi:tripartite-type tricarboxylate transporter receptor subunit TctC